MYTGHRRLPVNGVLAVAHGQGGDPYEPALPTGHFTFQQLMLIHDALWWFKTYL
jgi:hypothetical protein